MRLPRGRLEGTLRVPGSKSLTNRALVAAALAPGRSEIVAPLESDDTRVLAGVLERLGAAVERRPGSWAVTGPLSGGGPDELLLDVGPAGTPARFLLALLCALPGRFVLDGSPRMRERPMGPLVDALRSRGARIEPLGRDGFLPLRVAGKSLTPGEVSVRADVSSQFVSALMLVSPLLPGGLAVRTEGRAVSGAYVDLTREVRDAFTRDGACAPARYVVPGDDSAACFPIAGAVASRGSVRLEGLARHSRQPDAVFRGWASAAGGALRWEGEGESAVLVVDGGPVAPVDVDVDAAPDAALPLAALLAFANGTSRLYGAGRLREKESDRLAAAVDLLARAGAAVAVEGTGDAPALRIDGAGGHPRSARFLAHDDHRVAMSAAVLALGLPGESAIDDPEVVSKSWPLFWESWSPLVTPL